MLVSVDVGKHGGGMDLARWNGEQAAERWWQTVFALGTVITIGVGVFAWHWDAMNLVLLYWVENLILGVLQLGKMLFSRALPHRSKMAWFIRLFMMLFFMVHYGGFCGGHGMFLLTLSKHGGARILSEVSFAWGPLVFLDLLRVVTVQVLHVLPSSAMLTIAVMGLAQMLGMVRERHRWLHQPHSVLMQEPYKHIVVVHVAIIFGMFLAMILQNPWPVLGLIVLGKFLLDLRDIWRKVPSCDQIEEK